MKKSGLHFLVAARQCEIRELEQLMLTGGLVQHTARLVHALQKERGLSNLVLGTDGARFAEQRRQQIERSLVAEVALRASFDRLEPESVRIGNGARLFSRIAYVLHGLDALPGLRTRIDARALDAAESTKAYVKLVAGLLAMVFEAADSAGDPEVSRLLVALFNFMQGKEFAGQERATGAAAYTAGASEPARQQHWLHLIDSQERCFAVFADFAEPGPAALWAQCGSHAALAELERLRRIGCTAPAGSALDRDVSQTWFDRCTARIDAMQAVEARLAEDLLALCARKIAEARAELQAHRALVESVPAAALVAGSFFGSVDAAGPAPALGPHLERSVLELVQEQSRRLQAMGDELATARAALNERKLVERAKGLLMAHRQLSEAEAHKMLRQTAMSQNRRLLDVAEAVLSMADLLPTPTR